MALSVNLSIILYTLVKSKLTPKSFAKLSTLPLLLSGFAILASTISFNILALALFLTGFSNTLLTDVTQFFL